MLPQPLASGGDEAYAIRSQNAGVHANLIGLEWDGVSTLES